MTTDLERILFAELLKQKGCGINIDTEKLQKEIANSNKTLLSVNNYPDINLNEFIEWFEKKYFKPVEEIAHTPLFMGKYDAELWFHRDIENNQFSIELKFKDYSNMVVDRALQEALDDIYKNKLED